MNKQSNLMLLLLLLSLLSKVHAQGNPKRAEDTILKINKTENPYSDKITNWLIESGFQANEYSWENQEINRQLNECVKRRGGAVIFAMLAGSAGVLAISSESSGFLVPSAGLALISIGKTNKTKRQIKQIEKWRSVPAIERHDTVNLLEDSYMEFSLKSPYKTSQNKFLSKNGFGLHTYNWDDKVINLKLEKALGNRSTGNAMFGLSLGTFLMGSLFKMAAVLQDERAKSNDANSTGTNLYIASGGILLTSIIFNAQAKSKVRKAEMMRQTRRKNKLTPSDVH